ncbi:MAG: polysaccharide deacetylase family protein [Oscillospiraceae bacterium]|nr:polysaccharide deacetylase family protein [Oscillospiraceae bacterium]
MKNTFSIQQLQKKIFTRLPLQGIVLLLVVLMSVMFFGLRGMPVNSSTAQEVRLPILMYHQLTKDTCLVNEYCITKDQFAGDLAALKEMGYETVSMAQVIAFCERGEPLPVSKPIVISFDDGFESFYVYAFPLLKKHAMKAVLGVIGEEAERFSNSEDHRLKYSCCTWDQLTEMAESGLVEIESHTWNLHSKKNGRKGAAKKFGESAEAYRTLLEKDVGATREAYQKHRLPDFSVYVYPYGAFSGESPEILRSLGVRAAFVCDARVNVLRVGETAPLMELKRFNRVPGTFCIKE